MDKETPWITIMERAEKLMGKALTPFQVDLVVYAVTIRLVEVPDDTFPKLAHWKLGAKRQGVGE